MMRKILLIFLTVFYSCSTVKISEIDKKPFDIKVGSGLKKYFISDNSDILDYMIDTKEMDSKLVREGTITVEMVASNKMMLTLQIGEDKINKIFKGRLVDEEFRMKKRFMVKLYPPVYWVLIGDSVSMYKNFEDELVIVGEHGGAIFLTLMPIFGTNNGTRTRVFKEVD